MSENRFQYGISQLLGLTFAAACWLTLYHYGEPAAPWSLPLAILTAIAVDARPSVLKWTGLLVSLAGAAGSAGIAVRSYPLFVIADNLSQGADAVKQSQDAAMVAAFYLAMVFLAGGLLPGRRSCLAYALGLGAIVATVPFGSDSTPPSARWAAFSVLVLLAALRLVPRKKTMSDVTVHRASK